MALLCLGRSIKIDFASWLQESGRDLYLITSNVMPHQDRYRLVRSIDDMDAHGLAELAAVEIGRSVTLQAVIPHSEYDLIRAARIRRHLGIPGQSVESAIAYRDKVTMKEYLRRAGLRVANFARLTSPLDAIHFVEQHGFPVVIKPVDACGSKNVCLIEDHAALAEFLRTSTGRDCMIESFVDGRMYHVNGVLKEDGSVFFVPCAYITTCLDFQSGGIFGDRAIDPRTPFSKRLIECTKKAIAALPPAFPLAFHAEIFHTKDDELVLCEIAARTPGSITGELIGYSYDIDIHRLWIRSLAGLDDDFSEIRTPHRYLASVRIPVREGRLKKLPTMIPFPWVSTYCLTGVVGKEYRRATSYTDDVLSGLLVGSSEEQLKYRIDEFGAWVHDAIRWEAA
ncbi:ATP-grasp domain-containing protein [Pendulispora rubella]|uniref:ATP-grasp domain-containing protein n=1 Tax=Pendulispora rubella TaxID=2741070 RepID=A0ABZ2L8N1_9BACT